MPPRHATPDEGLKIWIGTSPFGWYKARGTFSSVSHSESSIQRSDSNRDRICRTDTSARQPSSMALFPMEGIPVRSPHLISSI
jgi:hypothetical protein